MPEYNSTDQHIHLLCQTIAKANRTYVPKKDDDSHTNLYFDLIANRMMGRWIERENGAIMLTLNLENQHFEWIDQSLLVLASISSQGRLINDIEAEIEQGLSGLGLDPKGFTDALHFEIPDYNFAEKPVSALSGEAMQEWARNRNLANKACYLVLGYLQAAGEVRIWPHHFDTGIYVNPSPDIGIGFGFAMKDEVAGEAYFYCSAYPSEGSINLEKAPSLRDGKWEDSEHFKGAVLPISAVDKNFGEVLSGFIQTVLPFYLAH